MHAVTIVLTANCGGHAAVLCSHCYAELVYVTPKHAQAAAVTAASGRPELPLSGILSSGVLQLIVLL